MDDDELDALVKKAAWEIAVNMEIHAALRSTTVSKADHIEQAINRLVVSITALRKQPAPVEPAPDTSGQDDSTADKMLKMLAAQLGVTSWENGDGSEEWEGDVNATICNILIAARVYDDEDGRIARLEDLAAPDTVSLPYGSKDTIDYGVASVANWWKNRAEMACRATVKAIADAEDMRLQIQKMNYAMAAAEARASQATARAERLKEKLAAIQPHIGEPGK